jgi:dTDP-4-amino-4,6-dideoxygalactose transaminase
VHYPPIHGFAYAGSACTVPLPVTDEVAPRLLTFRSTPGLTDDLVDLVADALLSRL